MGYSSKCREAVLKKMLVPNNNAIAELKKREGIRRNGSEVATQPARVIVAKPAMK